MANKKIDNKAEYYFGGKPVLERAPIEDEFQGSFTKAADLELLARLANAGMDPFWRDIWIQLATLCCTIEFEGDDIITLSDVPVQAVNSYNFNEMWYQNVNGANKKGWGWSGDTDVLVYEMSSPTDMREAALAVLLRQGQRNGQFWMRTYASAPSDGSAYRSWKDFWDATVRGENDLPAWNGRPTSSLCILSSGNDGIDIAQHGTSFYMIRNFRDWWVAPQLSIASDVLLNSECGSEAKNKPSSDCWFGFGSHFWFKLLKIGFVTSWLYIKIRLTMNNYGFIDLKSEKACPLKSISVTADFVDRFGTITVVQEFENNSSSPIEAVFTFPKDSQAAVTSFKVTTNNKTLIGELNASESAQEKYSDAIAEGKGAYLLDQKRADIITLYIGSFLPQQRASIELTYITEAQWEGDALRITFPTTIAPRYTPQQLQHDEEHQINPEYHSNDKLPYDFTFNASVRLTDDTISSFESPSHEFQIDLASDKKKISANATAKRGEILNNRDIVLMVHSTERKQRKQPLMIDEVDPNGHHALYLSFMPKLICKASPKTAEILFLLDRSGSMENGQIECAKSALQLFLRSLPVGCYFDIISFGSKYERLFRDPVIYNNETLEIATKKISNFSANFGGTEILAPLQDIYRQKNSSGRKRIIFVLTDGEVSNDKEVTGLIKKNSSAASVFTFGIGNNVSRQLVNGMAQAGNGYAEYVVGNERLQPKIIRQLKRALSNYTVRIDWKSDRVKTFPKMAKSISDDEPIQFMAFVEDNDYLTRNRTIDITIETGSGIFTQPFDLSELRQIDGKIIHQLFVKHNADELDSTATAKKRQNIQSLCLKYNVLSNLTSFLIVEQRKNSTEKTSKFVSVPLARPKRAMLRSNSSTVNSTSVSFGGGTFSMSYKATIGADFQTCRIRLGNNSDTVLQLWDPSGSERFSTLSQMFMRNSAAAILMYDVQSRKSFENLTKWIENMTSSSLDFDKMAVTIIGNKIDLPFDQKRQVSFNQGKSFADQYNVPFFEISVKDMTNMEEMFKTVCTDMYLKSQEQSKVFKMILVGDSGVGKTALVNRVRGSSVDLSEIASRFSLPITNNNATTQSQAPSGSTSLLGKLWSGISSVTGYFRPATKKNTASQGQIVSNSGRTVNQLPVPSTQDAPQMRLLNSSMNAVIMAQSALGAWKISNEISIELFHGFDVTSSKPDGVEDDIWMTLICIAYLSLVCNEHKSEWELIVQKAEAWLKSVNGNKAEWSQKARNTIQQYM